MTKKGDTEVGVKLTLDDQATAVLGKIKGGFDKVNETVERSIGRVLEFGRDIAAVAIGVNLGNILGSVREIGRGAVDAAVEGQRQMRELGKSIAGLATMRGGSDFTRAAQAEYDMLSKVARQAMVSRGELVEAFSETSKSTILSREQLEKFIVQVAKAGRALPGSISSVVQGFEQFRKNVISADNPLITMIKQANLLRGHSEQIALRLQYMGRPAALRLANEALRVMQERAKMIPPSLEDLQTQFSDLRVDVLRMIGTPMLAAFLPAFQQFQRYVSTNRDSIEKYAHMIGTEAGKWILEAAHAIERGFTYVKTHAAEIKKSIIEAWTFVKKVVDFLWSHRKELALGMVAAKATSTGAGAEIASAAGGGIVAFGRWIAAANVTLPKLNASMKLAEAYHMLVNLRLRDFTDKIDPAAKGLGALALAIGAVMLAMDQWQKLMKDIHDTTGGADDARAKFSALQDVAAGKHGGNAQQIQEWANYAKVFAAELGTSVEEINKLAAQAQKAAGDIADAASSFRIAGEAATMGDSQNQMINAANLFRLGMDAAGDATEGAAVDAAARAINGSQKLQQALLHMGTRAGLDLDKLADQLGDKIGDFAKKLHEQAGKDAEKSATGKKGAVTNNIFNGNIWNIKQDFRDQDPDRVITIFENDIANAAENRIQARTALPFGG